MINKISFDDEIVLYWDRQDECVKGYTYRLTYGEKTAYTEKTHFSIRDGERAKPFDVSVALTDLNGRVIKELGCVEVAFAKSKNRLDVTKAPYFAVGDGKTLNTAALQKAIDDCGADDCVYIPAGVFMTGALTLHSDMELFVDKGATLQGTANVQDYLPKIKSRFEGIERECYRSLLNLGEMNHNEGCTSKNVTIRGGGSILGGGRALMLAIFETEGGTPFNEDAPQSEAELRAWKSRGRLMQISNCENVVVADLTVGDGAAWNLHFIYCKNVLTFGCKIVSYNVNNGDGWDPDSSEDCTIFNCDFDTRDDMVAIKSGKNPEGNVINRPSRNIKVFDCRCVRGHGLAMGSEISGGIDGVYIWDCQMEKSRCGLEIKGMKCRGGYVKNVYAYDSSFSILAIRSVEYNDGGEAAPTPPVFENYHFENIKLTGVCIKHTGETWDEDAIIAEGFDGDGTKLKNVTMKNITLQKREHNPKQKIALCFVDGISIDGIFCK